MVVVGAESYDRQKNKLLSLIGKKEEFMRKNKILISLFLLIALAATPLLAQRKITTPKEHFGFNVGDDYYLANYTQFTAYLKKVALESKRVSLAESE